MEKQIRLFDILFCAFPPPFFPSLVPNPHRIFSLPLPPPLFFSFFLFIPFYPYPFPPGSHFRGNRVPENPGLGSNTLRACVRGGNKVGRRISYRGGGGQGFCKGVAPKNMGREKKTLEEFEIFFQIIVINPMNNNTNPERNFPYVRNSLRLCGFCVLDRWGGKRPGIYMLWR